MIGVLMKRESLDKGTQGKCHAKSGAVLHKPRNDQAPGERPGTEPSLAPTGSASLAYT